MRSLYSVLALLSASVFASTALLSMSASDQMAAKRRISLEYQHRMELCKSLPGDSADICKQQAKGQAEMARAALASRRNPAGRSPV